MATLSNLRNTQKQPEISKEALSEVDAMLEKLNNIPGIVQVPKPTKEYQETVEIPPGTVEFYSVTPGVQVQVGDKLYTLPYRTTDQFEISKFKAEFDFRNPMAQLKMRSLG